MTRVVLSYEASHSCASTNHTVGVLMSAAFVAIGGGSYCNVHVLTPIDGRSVIEPMTLDVFTCSLCNVESEFRNT